MNPAILSPATAGRPALPRQRRKADRRQELLDAALSLFVDKGFAATRAEEVAERAGVAKGTLYLYYPSKEELLKAVITHNISREIAASRERLEAFQGPTPELLRQLLEDWWASAGEARCGGICKLMMAEAGNFPELARFYEAEVIRPARALWAGVLQRGIERGEFRSLPVEATVAALMAPMLFLVTQQHVGLSCPSLASPVPPREVVAQLGDLLLHGLTAAPGGAAR